LQTKEGSLGIGNILWQDPSIMIWDLILSGIEHKTAYVHRKYNYE
jgi:hypothetical protein